MDLGIFYFNGDVVFGVGKCLGDLKREGLRVRDFLIFWSL